MKSHRHASALVMGFPEASSGISAPIHKYQNPNMPLKEQNQICPPSTKHRDVCADAKVAVLGSVHLSRSELHATS